MNDTDRAFYDAAMAEADLFVSAGYRGPRPPVSDAELRRLEEARNDQRFYDAAMAEEGLMITAGSVRLDELNPTIKSEVERLAVAISATPDPRSVLAVVQKLLTAELDGLQRTTK